MIKKYIDDVFYAGGEFRKGVKWDPTQKCLIWDPNQESEDKQYNKTNDHRTMEIVAQIASSIIKCLKFTWDSPSANKSGKMPVLDCQLWMEMDQRTRNIPSKIDPESPEMINPRELKPVIKYLFYKKPMASKTANKESNGLPEKTKISTAINKVPRRCKNTSMNLDDQYLENVLKD